ncbi:MAG: 50S ribosomal protein L6 [Candidatus Bathyarchaeia archaeon]
MTRSSSSSRVESYNGGRRYLSRQIVELEEKEVPIPEGVEVKLDGKVVEVKGGMGALREDFSHAPVELRLEGNRITVSAAWPRKRQRALVNTVASLIKNMITGVTEGFTYKLKIVYAHFPTSIKVDRAKKRVVIENFMGEKAPRTARIVGDVVVEVSGDEITVKGIRLQDVSQTAANIEQATRVKRKDLRVFLDGIYVYEKRGRGQP